MKQLKFLMFNIILGLIFYSCSKCDNIDCLSDNYYGQFRLVKATDGKDLVFGPNKIYDKNQIKFYKLNSTDTVFFEYQTIKFPNIGYDSILYVRFFPKSDIAYLRLSNGDVDTFNLSYNTFNTRCCGAITEITNFRLNNSVDIPGNKGTQEIKK